MMRSNKRDAAVKSTPMTLQHRQISVEIVLDRICRHGELEKRVAAISNDLRWPTVMSIPQRLQAVDGIDDIALDFVCAELIRGSVADPEDSGRFGGRESVDVWKDAEVVRLVGSDVVICCALGEAGVVHERDVPACEAELRE